MLLDGFFCSNLSVLVFFRHRYSCGPFDARNTHFLPECVYVSKTGRMEVELFGKDSTGGLGMGPYAAGY